MLMLIGMFIVIVVNFWGSTERNTLRGTERSDLATLPSLLRLETGRGEEKIEGGYNRNLKCILHSWK